MPLYPFRKDNSEKPMKKSSSPKKDLSEERPITKAMSSSMESETGPKQRQNKKDVDMFDMESSPSPPKRRSRSSSSSLSEKIKRKSPLPPANSKFKMQINTK